MNKNYKIEMETLTPVHIGSGEKAIFGLDYYLEGTKVIFIDSPKLIDKITEKERQELFRALRSKDIRNIKSLAKKYRKEIYAIENKADRDDLKRKGVDTILKTRGDRVYIPGSSIKGAIRTALIYNRMREKEKEEIREIANLQSIENKLEGVLKRKIIFDGDTDVDVLNSLIIRDSEEKRANTCTSTYTLNISIADGAYAHKQPIEAINSDEKFESEISIRRDMISIEEIKNASRKFSSEIIEHEKKFYERRLWWSGRGKRRGIKTESLLNFYKKLERELNNLGENDFLLNLGRHSGHHIKTGWSTFDYELLFDKGTSESIADLLSKQKDVRKPFPKTRRAVIEEGSLKPLGWVKVRVYEN